MLWSYVYYEVQIHANLLYFNFFFLTLIRSSILERCILKISTANVAVGTDDLDELKRFGACFVQCVWYDQ